MPGILEALRAHLNDRYDIERELGGGGMSRVYVAIERSLDRKVVIKVLAPELGERVNVDRFQQEIATAATLQHPQIVPVYHAGLAGELRYYVMPFVAGESLRHRMRREGRLAPLDVVRLLAPVARALAYAHRQGIVHRDVKPENILLAEGEPMLADFGIAKVLREGSVTSTGLTSAGISMGTVTYMPPEQVTADPRLDGRADVYSLAAVGYELLAGEPPFLGTPAQVMSAHVVQPVPPLGARVPSAPTALVDAIMGALAKDHTQRPDAERFAEQLDASSRGEGSGSRPALPAQGHPLRRPAAVAAGLALLALSWWWGGRSSVATTRDPTIAVLPFETIGAPEDAYLAAGVTDELMTGLAQVRGVRVLSRATLRAYADSQFTPADYAAKVGVRALVEGSVQRAGDQLRVTARLVDARDGSALWSDSYDRVLSDVFRTQREISSAVSGALTAKLGLASEGPRAEYVADAAAYDLFLRGRYALRERGETGLRSAMDLFAAAAVRDPAFARAHAGIAEAAALLPIYSTVTRASVNDTLRSSAARAIALDSLLATPHLALGLLAKGLGQWAEGERELEKARALDPNDGSVHQNLGELFFTLGRLEESRAALERAALLEPNEETIVAEFAYALLLTGELDSASRVVARAAAAAPRSPYVNFTQAALAERRGDAATAVKALRIAAEVAPLPFFRGSLARALHLAGDTAGARTIRAELDALGRAPGATFGRAIAGLPSDPPAETFARLDAAVAEGDPFVYLLPLRVWWYDTLRPDPRFAAFATRLGLPPLSSSPLPTGGR
jgi:TolB-like protein/tRNA A-37 threonylcarbamoyl transferase component Bud32/Tfp pilus assembly protein PilF